MQATERVEFLNDPQNFTGYSQVIRETHRDGSGQLTEEVTYTFGLDELSQTTVTFENGQANSPITVTFAHDGHGSVRALLDAAGAIATLAGHPGASAIRQLFTYDAYGNAIGFNMSAAATVLLYSGEQFDQRIQMQYLRARYSSDGHFNQLDPYVGNPTDPQSFHKYLYTHNNSINRVDPTGLSELLGLLTSFSVGSVFFRAGVGAALGAIDGALNDDPGASVLQGALMGAGFAVLGPAIPWWIGLPLAASGLYDAATRGDIDLLLFRGATLIAGGMLYRHARGVSAGGPLGKFDTRVQNGQAWLNLFARGWRLVRGGTAYPEERISLPQPNPFNRTYVKPDLTLVRTRGGQTQVIRVQTVTTLADGVTPTPSEMTNINIISQYRPNDLLIVIPKSNANGPISPMAFPNGMALRDFWEALSDSDR